MGSIYYLRRLISRRISFIRHIYERGGLRPIARQTPLHPALLPPQLDPRSSTPSIDHSTRMRASASAGHSCDSTRRRAGAHSLTPTRRIIIIVFQRYCCDNYCMQGMGRNWGAKVFAPKFAPKPKRHFPYFSGRNSPPEIRAKFGANFGAKFRGEIRPNLLLALDRLQLPC